VYRKVAEYVRNLSAINSLYYE